MTTSNPYSENRNWQELYSAKEGRWQDLQRMGRFLIPIAGLMFFATIYPIEYAAIHIVEWSPQVSSQITSVTYLSRIAIIVLAPCMAMILGLLLILGRAQEFLRIVYQPAEDEKLTPLIRRRLLGIPPLPPPLNTMLKYPFVVINKPELDEKHWTRWFGGPANLVIYEDVAIYIERGNKFSRVVGPGLPMPFLERYERIKEVVNLRPQIKDDEIRPWTKDGIRIKLKIRAECQINASDEALSRSPNSRFPFDPLAVKTAVEHMTVKVDPKGKLFQSSWLDGAWGTITGIINSYVASHSLDELFVAPQEGRNSNLGMAQNNTSENIEQIFLLGISTKVLERINNSLAQNGVKALSVQITNVEIPKDVLELRERYWESFKQKIAAVRNSRAEADRIRIREQAHAEAQRTMLNVITQRLENVNPNDLTESLMLSLSGILDQGLDDPIVRPLIAKETFAVLDRLRKMLNDRF